MSLVGTLIGTGADVLSGGLFGGILRLAPEVLRLFTSKADRAHEYRMAQLSLEAAKATADGRLAEIREAGAQQIDIKGIAALEAAVRAQGRPTGVAWADAMSATVRPIVTYWWLAIYTAVKAALITLALGTGDGWANAVVGIWTPFDSATFGGIISFWFLDRVMRKAPL